MVDEREDGMTPVRLAPGRARAEEWALVLEAEGMAPEIRSLGDEFILLVGSDDAHRAVEALWAYESENRPQTTPFASVGTYASSTSRGRRRGRGPITSSMTASSSFRTTP